MKGKFNVKSLLVALMLTLSLNLFSQSNTVTADVFATIVTPVSIENLQELNFGNIAPTQTAGSVDLSTNSLRTPVNVYLPSITGDVKAAQFRTTGVNQATYEITLPSEVIVRNGVEEMQVINFTHDSNNRLTGGKETFNVGATLNVKADQVEGEYSGEFEVRVNYN